MFQSIGNLKMDSRAALCFINFERGDVLEVSGKARVGWGFNGFKAVADRVYRMVLLKVEGVVRNVGVTDHR